MEARIWIDWQNITGKRKADLDTRLDTHECTITYHGARSATVKFIASRGVERWPFTLEETNETGKLGEWKTIDVTEGAPYIAMGQ